MRVSDYEKMIKHLLENGFAVRHTRNFTGLSGRYIQVETRQPSEDRKFVSVMKNLTLV